MTKLKAALEAVASKLGLNKDVLGKARRRHKKFRELAQQEHERQNRAEHHGHALRAAYFKRRAERCHAKSLYWKGRIKTQVARTHHLDKSVETIEAEIAEWHKEHGVYFEGQNKVRGGTPRQRLKAALLRSLKNYKEGKLPGYYAQGGAPRAYDHTLYHYPYGHIWDCSTYGDGIYLVCDLEAPSGPNTRTAGGYTGTQGEHGKQIPESKAQVGDLVLYGPFPHHHVEVVLDPERKTTCGHGSPPIDLGVFDLFGDGDFIIRTYL